MNAKVLSEGWDRQAFTFCLDASPSQHVELSRHFGMRRKAYNWTVEQAHKRKSRWGRWAEAFNAGDTIELPPNDPFTFYDLRKQWNQLKPLLCCDDNGYQWWKDLSKEAAANGIADAVDAYWRHQKSDKDANGQRLVGFPRFKRKGRDGDRYRVSTGHKLEDDRHIKIPKVGSVRVHENMRDLLRLIQSEPEQAKLGAMTITREGSRLFASFSVSVLRPQNRSLRPVGTSNISVVGVDAGVHWLAVVADADGNIIERVPNPKALKQTLSEISALQRSNARGQKGSKRHRNRNRKISELHARAKRIRTHAWHQLTTRLAKTHDVIVVESLAIAQMGQQKGLSGARKRRQQLYDAAMGTLSSQLEYKTGWYGSMLVKADRWFPSTKTCHRCGHYQNVGWARTWLCEACNTHHDRDDNAAINLAQYPSGAQQSCGCADCTVRSKRLSGHNTTQHVRNSEPVVVSTVMREDSPQRAVNPETGSIKV